MVHHSTELGQVRAPGASIQPRVGGLVHNEKEKKTVEKLKISSGEPTGPFRAREKHTRAHKKAAGATTSGEPRIRRTGSTTYSKLGSKAGTKNQRGKHEEVQNRQEGHAIDGRMHRIGLQIHRRNGERERKAVHPRAEKQEGARVITKSASSQGP